MWERQRVSSKMTDCLFLIPDEDGTEFEKEITEALEGLTVSSTADKLSKVPVKCLSVIKQFSANRVSVIFIA